MAAIDRKPGSLGKQGIGRCLLSAVLLFCYLSLSSQIMEPYYLSKGVDELPENIGGKTELKRFLEYHMIYPDSALKKKIEGTVEIIYVCNKKGFIISHKLLKSVDPALDAEAERLFRLLLWSPAIKQMQEVQYEYYIAIPFSVSRYKKALKRRDRENANPGQLPIDSSNVIYEQVNKPPSYIYGKDSLLKYIASELEYPSEAKTKNLEGTVTLSFVVEPNGFVSNIKVEQGVGGGCNEEAIRVIGQTKWFPAQTYNTLVRYKMTYSIGFKLSSDYHDNVMGSQRSGGY
jgi:TonB family protein